MDEASSEDLGTYCICVVALYANFGAASANSVEYDLGCTSRVYFDNVTLTSQKPCQHNNKFDCSTKKGYNIPQDAI